MINLFTYEEVRALNEQRRERSLARYERARQLSELKKSVEAAPEADVIELVFGAHCDESEPIGA